MQGPPFGSPDQASGPAGPHPFVPELPEVETVVRGLAGSLPGKLITRVEVLHPDLLSESPDSFSQGLVGSAFRSVTRRGKNIVLALSSSELLVVNLGMTGRLLLASTIEGHFSPKEEKASHLGVAFRLAQGGSLLYDDTRRFGSLRRYAPARWQEESTRLGPEPLDPDLTPEGLYSRLLRSRSPLRSWLLDQTRIAGVGNIYACEALFRAGIHPKRPASSLDRAESARLLSALREVLLDAIRARGTTLRDYRTAEGEEGDFGPSLHVYGREGEPCPRCNTPIERIVFGNRSAFLCPRCQSVTKT